MPSFGGYTYNFNNPIKYTDPTGMMPEESGDPKKKSVDNNNNKNWKIDATFPKSPLTPLPQVEPAEIKKAGCSVLAPIVPDLRIVPNTTAPPKPNFFSGLLRGIGIASLAYVINGLFSSAHTPNNDGQPTSTTWTLPTDDVSSFGQAFRSKESRENHPGSYTIEFNNGKRYHGKGSIKRATKSAVIKMLRYSINHNEPVLVVFMSWGPSISERQAHKDEHTRMQTDKTTAYPQGYKNPVNYNERNSWGYLYKLQDGESVD